MEIGFGGAEVVVGVAFLYVKGRLQKEEQPLACLPPFAVRLTDAFVFPTASPAGGTMSCFPGACGALRAAWMTSFSLSLPT